MNAPAFRADHLGHYFYGSHAAWLGASIAMAAAVWLVMAGYAPRLTLVAVLFIGAVAALASAGALGWWKEWVHDKGANEEAAARGEPPPHGVETSDFKATLAGAAPVAAVLLVLAALRLMVAAG